MTRNRLLAALLLGLLTVTPAAEAKTPKHKPAPQTHKHKAPKKAQAKTADPAPETTTTTAAPPAPPRLRVVNAAHDQDGEFHLWIGLADDEPAQEESAVDLEARFTLSDWQGHFLVNPVGIGVAPADGSCPAGTGVDVPCEQPYASGPLTHSVVGVIVTFPQWAQGDILAFDGLGIAR